MRSTFSPSLVVRRTVARGLSSPTALGSTSSSARVFCSEVTASSRRSTAKASARAASGRTSRQSAAGSAAVSPFFPLAGFGAGDRSRRTDPLGASIATAVTSPFSSAKTFLLRVSRSSLDGSFRS